jgi:hypothetical protein
MVQAHGGVKMRVAGTDGVIVPQLALIVANHEKRALTGPNPCHACLVPPELLGDPGRTRRWPYPPRIRRRGGHVRSGASASSCHYG